MLNLALIVGSTRQGRFADKPADWIRDGAAARQDFRLETLDLRDFALPFFGEPDPENVLERWRAAVGRADGFIVTTAEYNHGPTAVLKNALDSAGPQWNLKPISFVGYGGTGASRAVGQLRQIAVELQLVPAKHAVHINMEPFVGIQQEGKTIDSYEYLTERRTQTFDELVQVGTALKGARETAAKAA